MFIKLDPNKTPRCDKLENLRLALAESSTPAYKSALKLCKQLERELRTLQNEYDELCARS